MKANDLCFNVKRKIWDYSKIKKIHFFILPLDNHYPFVIEII